MNAFILKLNNQIILCHIIHDYFYNTTNTSNDFVVFKTKFVINYF